MDNFSPLRVSRAIIEPLRHFFRSYAPAYLKYAKDPTTTKIEIGTVNDFHKVAIESLPRILVDRGPYSIHGRLLDEDLAQGLSPAETLGARKDSKHSFVQGQMSIMIEAAQEGECEVIADMVTSYLTWTCHGIAREYGLKSIARPMQVGSCAPFENGERPTSFRVVISVPYEAEMGSIVSTDGIKIKSVDSVITSSS